MSAEIIGREAIAAAARGDGELRAHADLTGASDRPISEDEALLLLEEDPALVYLGPRKLPGLTLTKVGYRVEALSDAGYFDRDHGDVYTRLA